MDSGERKGPPRQRQPNSVDYSLGCDNQLFSPQLAKMQAAWIAQHYRTAPETSAALATLAFYEGAER